MKRTASVPVCGSSCRRRPRRPRRAAGRCLRRRRPGGRPGRCWPACLPPRRPPGASVRCSALEQSLPHHSSDSDATNCTPLFWRGTMVMALLPIRSPTPQTCIYQSPPLRGRAQHTNHIDRLPSANLVVNKNTQLRNIEHDLTPALRHSFS